MKHLDALVASKSKNPSAINCPFLWWHLRLGLRDCNSYKQRGFAVHTEGILWQNHKFAVSKLVLGWPEPIDLFASVTLKLKLASVWSLLSVEQHCSLWARDFFTGCNYPIQHLLIALKLNVLLSLLKVSLLVQLYQVLSAYSFCLNRKTNCLESSLFSNHLISRMPFCLQAILEQ